MRITVRRVGLRNEDLPHCVICGGKRSIGKEVKICSNMCHWLLPGWVGYDATLKEIKFLDVRALALARLHRWDKTTKRVYAPSFTKVVSAARALGWDGSTAAMSQPTFVEAA